MLNLYCEVSNLFGPLTCGFIPFTAERWQTFWQHDKITKNIPNNNHHSKSIRIDEELEEVCRFLKWTRSNEIKTSKWLPCYPISLKICTMKAVTIKRSIKNTSVLSCTSQFLPPHVIVSQHPCTLKPSKMCQSLLQTTQLNKTF